MRLHQQQQQQQQFLGNDSNRPLQQPTQLASAVHATTTRADNRRHAHANMQQSIINRSINTRCGAKQQYSEPNCSISAVSTRRTYYDSIFRVDSGHFGHHSYKIQSNI